MLSARMFISLAIIFLTQVPVMVQAQGFDRDLAKKFEYECFLNNELTVYQHCVRRELYKRHKKQQLDDGKVFTDEFRDTTYRDSLPKSCIPLGEFYESRGNKSAAKAAYDQACGVSYALPIVKVDDKNNWARWNDPNLFSGAPKLPRKRCLRPGQEGDKVYDHPCVPKPENLLCDPERYIGCVRAGSLLRSQEQFDSARKYFDRACKGGIREGCEKFRLPDSEGSQLLQYASSVLMMIAVLIIVNMIFQDESEFKASEKLEEGGEKKDDIAQHGAILKYSRPFFKRYVTPIVSSMKIKKKIKEKYKRPLASAGLTEVLSPEDFYSFKLFLIVGFPLLFIFIRWFLEETWPFTLVPVIAGVGFIYPDIWIKGKIQQRQEAALNAMPFAVDMLALSVEAGLDFIAAMTKVIEKAKPSPLVDEFQILVKEIKIGASRAEALRNMAWRLDMIQMSSFTATLIAADAVGASIGPILKSLSIEIRQKKSSDVEKKGATAATKILFPMLFLITPAVFVVVGAPLLLEAMGLKPE